MRRVAFLAMAALTAAVLSAAGAYGEEPVIGRADYLRYCSACHGDDGRGDGVVSGLMQPRPTDLTQLAKPHGGTFPTTQVIESIDGRKQPQAHGSSEMPVWGEVLAGEKAMAQSDAHVRGRVQAIAHYVSTLQAK
jgi:mono/diheme cytochrome c family protein